MIIKLSPNSSYGLDVFVILWIETETTLKCDWYTINLVNNKTINFIFLGNDSDSDRSLTIHANAFNASDVISFLQNGKNE